jgi:hypothetical protein
MGDKRDEMGDKHNIIVMNRGLFHTGLFRILQYLTIISSISYITHPIMHCKNAMYNLILYRLQASRISPCA